MFFGKKSKEPQLPEPFGAEDSFGSAGNEPPKTPTMPPLKMDDIKKAVTMTSLKPPIPPPRMDAPPAAPVFQMQAPPQINQFQNPQQAPPRAFPSPPAAQQPPAFQLQSQQPLQANAFQPQSFQFQNQQPPQAKTFQPQNQQQPQPVQFQNQQPPQAKTFQPQNQQQPQSKTFQFQAPPAQQKPVSQMQQFQNQRAPPAITLQPPRLQPIAQKRQDTQKPADADIPEEGSPFSEDSFETPAAGKNTDGENGEETPEAEFHADEKRAPKAEKKEKPAVPRILPPPPPPHMETPEAETDKEEEHARHKQKRETLIDASQPELLRALVELVNKSATVQLVEALKDEELSLAEIINKTGIDENDLKDILHRFTCLGLVKEFWYKSPAGNHIRKYKLETTKGTVEFDLLALKDTLPIEELKAKSTRLVALITTGGRMPKSVLMKALPVMDDEQLEQVIRYTEKFKLPSIRDMLTIEAKMALDSRPSKQDETGGDEKPPEVTDLYYEIENIQKSLGELE